jgi:hypothetical protein
MQVIVSHVFWGDNFVADKLANLVVSVNVFIWWNSTSYSIRADLPRNMDGLSYFRFFESLGGFGLTPPLCTPHFFIIYLIYIYIKNLKIEKKKKNVHKYDIDLYSIIYIYMRSLLPYAVYPIHNIVCV